MLVPVGTSAGLRQCKQWIVQLKVDVGINKLFMVFNMPNPGPELVL